MGTFQSIAQLRESMQVINQTIDILNTYLQDMNQHLFAMAFQLPDVKPCDEHQPITDIPVNALKQNDALIAACQAYKLFYTRPNVSSKVTYRLPGLIVLPKRFHHELLPLVTKINEEKTLFHNIVQTLGDRDKKFDLVHQTFPGLVTLQAYRKISLLHDAVQSIGFTWANKQSIKKLERDKALAILEKNKRKPPATMLCEQWSKCIEQEMADIQRLPQGAQIRQRRPIKTHPMLNVRRLNQTPTQQQYKASLPLLLCQDEQPRIKPLQNYPAKTRNTRQDKTQLYPIVPRLHWYYLQT